MARWQAASLSFQLDRRACRHALSMWVCGVSRYPPPAYACTYITAHTHTHRGVSYLQAPSTGDGVSHHLFAVAATSEGQTSVTRRSSSCPMPSRVNRGGGKKKWGMAWNGGSGGRAAAAWARSDESAPAPALVALPAEQKKRRPDKPAVRSGRRVES